MHLARHDWQIKNNNNVPRKIPQIEVWGGYSIHKPYLYLLEVERFPEEPQGKQIKVVIKEKTAVKKNITTNGQPMWSMYARNPNMNKVRSPKRSKQQMITDIKSQRLHE